MPFRRTRRRGKPRKVSKAVKSYVNRTISSKAETKFLLFHMDNHVWNISNPVKLDLLTCAQGTDQNERIGNRIQLMSVLIRIQALTDDTNFARCFLAWVRDGSAASAITLSTTDAVDFDQFIIKWDSKKPLQLQAVNTIGNVYTNFHHLRTKKIIHYNDETSGSKEGFNLVLLMLNGSASANIGLNYEIRVFYKDL